MGVRHGVDNPPHKSACLETRNMALERRGGQLWRRMPTLDYSANEVEEEFLFNLNFVVIPTYFHLAGQRLKGRLCTMFLEF